MYNNYVHTLKNESSTTFQHITTCLAADLFLFQALALALVVYPVTCIIIVVLVVRCKSLGVIIDSLAYSVQSEC